jgi:glutamyl-tRNA synthetase
MKEAYDWIIEDLRWLGVVSDEIIFASDRLQIYYEYAEKLIRLGKAYVCKCLQDVVGKNREKGVECPCRKQVIEANLMDWRRMLHAEFKEGAAVLRVKTDMKHKNPALRDWVAFKIVDEANHPRSNAKVWPLLNFASAVDDHLLNVTHIIRGVDLAFTELQQRYVYEYFGWKYPETIVTGRLNLEGTTLSKSDILKGMKEGKYKGWNDPKLGTLMGMRARGILPDAIKKLIFDLGVRKNSVTLIWDNINAANKWAMKNKFQIT